MIIVSLVFDDTREDGIRESISWALNDSLTFNSLNKYKKFNDSYNILKENSNYGSNEKQLTIQEKTEAFINKFLGNNLELWKHRSTIKTNIYTKLYYLRNNIFGINSSTKRSVIYGPYNKNLNALSFLAKETLNHGVSTIFYIAPIRQDIEIPYYKNEYNNYKQDVQNIANENKIKFLNLEKLVPS